ncbi:MAG TPA: EthD family reductase [Acidobacteriaceae bacterium]
MMARLVVMYMTPTDAAAFDKYYFETHVPIAKKIPGLRKYEVSAGGVGSPAGDSGVHLVATLHFDDVAAIGAAFASAEGQAAAADVQVFAPGDGARMLMFETREV